MQLSCLYNTALGDEEVEAEDEESIDDVFRFDSASVLPSPDADLEGVNIYEAETENMDGVSF